jgi:hypothetical protein
MLAYIKDVAGIMDQIMKECNLPECVPVPVFEKVIACGCLNHIVESENINNKSVELLDELADHILVVSDISDDNLIDYVTQIFGDTIREESHGAARLGVVYVNKPLDKFFSKYNWYQPNSKVSVRGAEIRKLPDYLCGSEDTVMYCIGKTPYIIEPRKLVGIARKNSKSRHSKKTN